MECGVPFCHHGCPLGNLIPDWNDLVYRDNFADAIRQLHRTNNFPEFTGRLCPAPCEAACVLEIDEGNAVTIKQIEVAIVNRAWDEGWIVPQPPRTRTGRTVAVIGVGPRRPRLRAAAEPRRPHGHRLRARRGGRRARALRRPRLQDREVARRAPRAAARRRRASSSATASTSASTSTPTSCARRTTLVVIATGARVPRDLPLPGRELDGVHFAMEYLYQRNRFVAGAPPPERVISAAGKHVIVIGGGDTGADCVGNAHREHAASVTQIELVGEPPPSRPDEITPWPRWPMKLRGSYALNEGGERSFSISTTHFSGNGRVERDPLGPERGRHRRSRRSTAPTSLGPPTSCCWRWASSAPSRSCSSSSASSVTRARTQPRPAYATSVDGVFAAGDARRGQSLIVWAINEGRQCATAVDQWLARVPPADNAYGDEVDRRHAPRGPANCRARAGAGRR